MKKIMIEEDFDWSIELKAITRNLNRQAYDWQYDFGQ